jgi:hypothetical protein
MSTELVPVLKVKITQDDLNHKGMVKGHIVYQLMNHTKQPLQKITAAIARQELLFSLSEFIDAAYADHKYTQKDLHAMMIKAIKKTWPGMLDGIQGSRIRHQIKEQIKRVYGQGN